MENTVQEKYVKLFWGLPLCTVSPWWLLSLSLRSLSLPNLKLLLSTQCLTPSQFNIRLKGLHGFPKLCNYPRK
jgi:hypothetical protein